MALDDEALFVFVFAQDEGLASEGLLLELVVLLLLIEEGLLELGLLVLRELSQLGLEVVVFPELILELVGELLGALEELFVFDDGAGEALGEEVLEDFVSGASKAEREVGELFEFVVFDDGEEGLAVLLLEGDVEA